MSFQNNVKLIQFKSILNADCVFFILSEVLKYVFFLWSDYFDDGRVVFLFVCLFAFMSICGKIKIVLIIIRHLCFEMLSVESPGLETTVLEAGFSFRAI